LVQKIVYSLFSSVGQVWKSPADISNYILFVILNQDFDESWHSSSNQLVLGLRSSSAKVWKSPRSISHKASSSNGVVKNICNFIKSSTSQNAISGGWAISSDVSDTPDDLLNNLDLRRLKKLNEMAQHIFLNQIGNVVGSAWGDIGQAPGGFKLKLRNSVVKQSNECWH